MLRAAGICADYGSFRALFEVSLEIASGETVAVIGANGAGKTTLLRVISGMLPPRSGALVFDGRSLVGLKPHRIVETGSPTCRRAGASFPASRSRRICGWAPSCRPQGR